MHACVYVCVCVCVCNAQGDDKKLFVWEYGIGTAPMKHVAEPWMHSMPTMTCAPEDDGSLGVWGCEGVGVQGLGASGVCTCNPLHRCLGARAEGWGL
jgi:hypothetical protein